MGKRSSSLPSRRSRESLPDVPVGLLLVGLAGSPATKPKPLSPDDAALKLRKKFQALVLMGVTPEVAIEQLARDHAANWPSQQWIYELLKHEPVDHRHLGASVAGVTRYGPDSGLALLGAARKSWEAKPTRCSDVFDVSVELIDPDPSQPRKTFDVEALRELGESMRIRQIHAIMVRPDESRKGRFIIVAGERRWRAANLVRLATIRAEVCNLTAEEVAQVQLAENENRVQPPESETADFVATQLTRGLSVDQIARAMGRTTRWVEGRACMAKLAPNLKRQLDAKTLPVSVAAALCELPIEIQTAVWESARDRSKTASGQEAYVRAVVLKQAGKDLFGQPVIEFINGLSPSKRRKLGTQISKELRAATQLSKRTPAEILAGSSSFPLGTTEGIRLAAQKLAKLAKETEAIVLAQHAARDAKRARAA